MAEQETGNIMVMPKQAEEGITLRVREFSASGAKQEHTLTLPRTGIWFERQLKALCLKSGPMADQSMGNILCAVLYAEEMGLSAILGDLYFVGGRIATTADAKIRHALSSGLVAGYQVEMAKGAKITIPYTTSKGSGTWTGDDLHAKVIVHVKGWAAPVIYESDLRDWFNGANAAWREHTAFMFRKNALSKALAEVAPLGVDAEEIPAAAADLGTAVDIVKQLVASATTQETK